jgi:hypothetical protein
MWRIYSHPDPHGAGMMEVSRYNLCKLRFIEIISLSNILWPETGMK